MTVPPCSQLTSRIVPASTLRRKDATITGSTTSTPKTIAAIRMSVFIELEVKEDVRSRVGNPDGTAMTRGVDAGDPHEITRADAGAARAIVGGEGGEQLHHLTIDIQGDEALAIRVEPHHGACVVLDRALEGRGRGGLEAEQHAPERADQESLERGRGEDGGAGAPWLAERRGDETA